MSLFSKLFSSSINQPVSVAVEITQTGPYVDVVDYPPPRAMAPVEIPGFSPQDAIGFFNLGAYKVVGHIINPETGRQNKKTSKINAVSIQDAETAAEELGILPPFSVEVLADLNTPPNEYQVANAKEYGIEIPAGAVDADVGAMVYRKTTGGGVIPTSEFAVFCTQKRLLFSRFISETDLARLAYTSLSEHDRVALFAHAVYCAYSRVHLGSPLGDPKCYSFADNAGPGMISDIDKLGLFDLPVPRKGTKVWNAVCNYYSLTKK